MERLTLVLQAAAEVDPEGAPGRLKATRAPDLYLVNRGEQAETLALALARKLRAAGVSVELDGSGAAFAKQFKRAARSGSAWAAVIGDEEAEAGQFRLKPLLAEGEERSLALNNLDGMVAVLKITTEGPLGLGNQRYPSSV